MPGGTPAKIGRYEIRRELGRGMMGVVYEAVDPSLRRRVALKTIEVAYAVTPAEREAFEQRFLNEARVAARLAHPSIVVVHDVGRDPDTHTPYMALEYLEGQTLAQLTSKGVPMEWHEALRITARLADALHAAHGQGVIHRDVKPANIMLSPSGEPKLMDFGIAKVPASELTVTGQVFGTPSFMSPEQALAEPVDARSDLFSLGTVLYLLLTGRKAFAGDSVPQIINMVVRQDPPPPSHVVRSLPPAVDYVVARCLAKARGDRYPDGRTLAEDLDDVIAGRPPRHGRTWMLPDRVEGTVVAPSPESRSQQAAPRPTAPVPPRASEPPRQSRPVRHPRRWAPALWAAVGAGAGLVVLLAMWAFRTFDTDRPVAAIGAEHPFPVTDIPAPSPSAAAAPEAFAPAPNATAAPTEPLAEPAPSPTPSPRRAAPRPSAPPTTTAGGSEPTSPQEAAAAQDPASADSAQLTIDFEHSLKTGSLRVWLDDALVLDADLEGRLTKKIAVLKIRKGRVEQTIPVASGRREVRVQVAWDDNVRTDSVPGTFEPGTSRLLEVRLGRIRKNLSLEWR